MAASASRVTVDHADAEIGSVLVRYWLGHMGTALSDAGLVTTSREIPVPPDWQADPFSLPKKIRAIALGCLDDFDDDGFPPRARVAMVEPGSRVTKHFIKHRKEILYGMGEKLFPNDGVAGRHQRKPTADGRTGGHS